MNKKLSVLALIILIIIPLVLAQSPPDVGNDVNNIQNAVDTTQNIIRNNETRTDYLKGEWSKILGDTPAGPILRGIDKVLNFFNPLFKIVLGVEYSLSWAFIFSIIIWLILFGLILSPSITFTKNIPLGIVSAFLITSLIGISGAIKKLLDLLSIFVTNIWITLSALIISLFISFMVGKLLKQTIEKEKKKAEEEKLNRSRTLINMQGEMAEKEINENI